MPTATFRYRSDDLRSIESDATDPFGHRDYANTVVSELKAFPPQFTFGLFGDWGSGKSTILGEVGNQLRADGETKTAFVLFDAWRYDGDSLRREFIRTVGESLREQGALKKSFDFERHIESFETEITTSRRRLGFDAIALRDGAIAALFVAAIVAAIIFLLPKVGLSRPTTLKVLIAASSAVTAFVLFAFQRVVAPDPVQAKRGRLEFPDQFASNFKELLGNVRVRRVVIAIDNLDRCSPARVTEVLSSIKTFLEPAFAEGATSKISLREVAGQILLGKKEEDSLGQMCFIVAADDAALRRHLVAQELSKKSARGAGASVDDLPVEVRTAVDEYLRKFFGASLRIRNLLDEDIRHFTGEELREFNRSRDLSEELSRRLVEMTSHGLKRNPRRIKQFVNNLQMRLQMLAERKEGERIQIDADILVVAKLAIIEEEFVEEFEELENDPTLLGTWQLQARTSGDADNGPRLDSKFASFLRFTDDIQPRHIRTYLSLKQTKSELSLPRYGEFVDLLDDGDVEKLGQLLDEEQGEEAKYTEAARTHFLEQRRVSAWSRAHNALRSIVETPLLHGGSGEVVRGALEVALQEPSLEARLGQLEADALLAVAVSCELPLPKLRRVVMQVIDALGSPAGQSRHAASKALAAHVSIVDSAGRQRIRELLSAEDVKADFDSYLPLAKVLPGLLSHEMTDAALARLEELGAEGVSAANSAFAVAVESLVAHNDAARMGRLLGAARVGLEVHLDSGSEEFGSVAKELARAVETAEGVAPMAEFADWLASNRANLPTDSRSQALDLALALTRRSPEADAGAGIAVGTWIFELGAGHALSGDDFDLLPAQVRAGIAQQMSEVLLGNLGNLSEGEAEAMFASLSTEAQSQVTHDTIMVVLAREQWKVAVTLLKKLDPEAQRKVMADIVVQVGEAPGSHLGGVEFILEQRSWVEDGQLFELAMKIAQTIYDDRGAVQALAPELEMFELPSAEHRLRLVEHLLKTERDMGDPANRNAVLRAAWRVAGKPGDEAREAVEERLREVRSDSSVATLVAELLGEA